MVPVEATTWRHHRYGSACRFTILERCLGCGSCDMPPKLTVADPGNQKSISAFFKRKSPPARDKPNSSTEPILILSEDEAQPEIRQVKRPKLEHRTSASSSTRGRAALQAYKLPAPSTTNVPQPGTAFDDYSVGLSVEQRPEMVERTQDQERRHREWQRRVAAPEGLVPRRRSLALDDAEAEGAVSAGDGEPGPEDAGDGAEDRDVHEESSIGHVLRAKYAAPNKSTASKATAKGKSKKQEEIGPSGLVYTPLEKQYMDIKAANPDVLLLMEVGYKYKFHGDDAKIASKELGIACFPSRNFYNASIPTHRLHVHVKKLISQGYKVGVVTQTETAALKKAGDNRNAPFTRELTHLYTAATYVEDPSSTSSSNMADDPILPGTAPPPTNALVAIVEDSLDGAGLDEKVNIGLVSIVPSTGEVVWDEFQDTHMRSELETRMTHIQPAELLLPDAKLSRATEKVLNFFAGVSRTSSQEAIRIERIAKVRSYPEAKLYLADFYKRKRKEAMDVDGASSQGDLLATFPESVVRALAVAVSHLIAFKLDNAFVHRASFTRFSQGGHMLLSGSTLANLEIYRNQTDLGIYGSLMWLIDHTKTRMGRRLLREWIGRPLLDKKALEARIDAVEEILNTGNTTLDKLQGLLINMPDLVKGLTRVHYGKALPAELATILVSLARVGAEFKESDADNVQSELLKTIIASLPSIYAPSKRFLEVFNIKEARAGNDADMWLDHELYPDIRDAKDCIDVCDMELAEHLKDVRKVLKKPSLKYITVSGIENLVEVPMRDSKTVPPRWVKISATKTAVRFHSPEIIRMLKEKEQHRETLAAAARAAFIHFQSEIAQHYEFLVVTKQLAIVDCLLSFAQVACLPGYSKPIFVADNRLTIKGGRHPMVESLREDAYVPFDIDFSASTGPAKIITGPNMSGKSSAVRATALIVCLAQIGCFVPCDRATLGVHDAIATRMGASDDLSRGKSTFMVELSETSEILKTVTPRTLVILDELGRGTSTFDGAAIANATLRHLTGVGCNTLFVTHYPMVALELVKDYPTKISNWHMSFTETKMPDGSSEIIFLYKLSAGLAAASFGVWCAQLAGLPKSVLVEAQLRSDQMKAETERRLAAAVVTRIGKLMTALFSETEPAQTVENARFLLRNIH